MLDTSKIVNFLSFMLWSETELISIDYLNSINLSKDKKSLEILKEDILGIFKSEIKSYNLVDEEHIWLLLSGWLDSLLLLDLLKSEFPNSVIYTYTLWYSKLDKHLKIAKNISERYQTVHREVIFDLKNNLLHIFDEIYSLWYDLEGEDSLIMNHILSKEVKKECKIVFSWFGLDYIFAWMDLFRNSFNEKLYNKWLINKTYLLESVNWNKFYLKSILDNIKNYDESFFLKYGEYYWDILLPDFKKQAINYFYQNFNNIRQDISELKKQIYYIINTSLSNRYNPYNEPYKKNWVRHLNPFWSKDVITKILSLNISEEYLYNPITQEKKYIIREIARDLLDTELLSHLHSWTVLKYDTSIRNNKNNILKIVHDNKDVLSMYLNNDFLNNLDKIIENSMWYENSKKIIILLQMLFYVKNRDK